MIDIDEYIKTLNIIAETPLEQFRIIDSKKNEYDFEIEDFEDIEYENDSSSID